MKTHFLICTFCILIFSCTRLVPTNCNKTSKALPLNVDYDSIPIRIKYMDTKYNHLILDVELTNLSQDTLYLSPQRISYYGSDIPFDPICTYRNTGKRITSRHPPDIRKGFACNSRDINDIYRYKMKSKATISALLFIVGAGLSVYDDIKDDEDSKKEAWTKKDELHADTRDALVGASFLGANLLERSASKDAEDYTYLPYELFPEGAVWPGESVRGKVYLNGEDMFFWYYRIILPVGKMEYVFDFKRRR